MMDPDQNDIDSQTLETDIKFEEIDQQIGNFKAFKKPEANLKYEEPTLKFEETDLKYEKQTLIFEETDLKYEEPTLKFEETDHFKVFEKRGNGSKI